MSSLRFTSRSALDRIWREEDESKNRKRLNINTWSPLKWGVRNMSPLPPRINTQPSGRNTICTSPSTSRRPPPSCSWQQCPRCHCRRWNSYLLPWEPFCPEAEQRENRGEGSRLDRIAVGLVVVTGVKCCLIFDVEEAQACARQVVYRLNKATRGAACYSVKAFYILHSAFCILHSA